MGFFASRELTIPSPAQYLAKTPGGHCGLGGTGVSCPAELADAD